ncbi:hypothetical protein SAMN05216553_10992 [Lentzea fradiae]|uniref:Uncharacterized protein n=1 Tax=Lentzea fradiae TaxID=200378 RepID=A0A1G7V992_9PSEU|nr:hypothetical protein [Lentzea fradiae]SDG56333.1 hypothetical protein SAMN05216553_10992 [Lentzea fradiae]
MTPTSTRTPTRRPLRAWPFYLVALALVIAGVLLPHALMIAAGLIIAGSAGLAHKPADR